MVATSMRKSTTPIDVIRSRRSHETRVLTSLPAGKMVPLHAVPLLREDKVDSATFRFSFEMQETVELLMNSVLVNVKAYLVPHLAYERFSGMDELNRSFAGLPNQEGGAVTPYFTTAVAGAWGSTPIHEYMGVHGKQGDTVNLAYIEAYNLIWNFRAKNRSPNIAPRTIYQGNLAPAFWQHEMFAHIVPDFDQAVIDGQVSLNVIASQLPVKQMPGTVISLKHANGSVGNLQTTAATPAHLNMGAGTNGVGGTVGLADVSNIYAELTAAGVTVSLSNIEMARKTQAFAKLREQFNGHSDEYIIDMLMDGLSIPEQAFRQPILLAEESTVFGQSKRYASDAANLTKSVTNGMTQVDMRIRCPQVPMGGVIMFVAEITPEQLFERQRDPYLYLTDPEKMPHYLRDTLDPEKVEVVKNARVDVAHGTPNGTFGYQPLNADWNRTAPNIGGKFFRPTVNTAFDEERQRIWSVETVNPTLSADFYLCNTMHQKPFVVTNKDPFEVVIRGSAVISGNTVFGGPLVEGTNDWAEVVEEIDQSRIVK